MSSLHTSVLSKEVIDGLHVNLGKRYIDATVGAGGHARLLLECGASVLGIDQDQDAVKIADSVLGECQQKIGKKNRYRVFHGSYSRMGEFAREMGWNEVDGILMDLGVSSMQLDNKTRGFSVRYKEALLDMRMDATQKLSASDIVNSYSEDELYEIFATFGEEEHSRSIARALVSKRHIVPIRTVGALIDAIAGIEGIGNKQDTTIRIFQAIRIEVNDELRQLRVGISESKKLLSVGGRLAVISFHSLEDRIVKQAMNTNDWKLITKKPIRPTEQEMTSNRRSRSAKLRIAEKL